MKKFLNVMLIIFTVIFVIGSGFMIYCLAITVNEKLDKNKLITEKTAFEFYDSTDNSALDERTGKQAFLELKETPSFVKNAFVAVEDKRFYSHHGVDYKRMMSAAFKNAVSFSFKEGASTISQQLIKNTHLSNKKTLSRKIKEIKLASDLEKHYSKSEILEMYLNTIYFGEGCYGISDAAMKYFSKSTKNLTVAECATLAAIIKAPTLYSPLKHPEKAKNRRNAVLKCMYDQNYINEETYSIARQEPLSLSVTSGSKSCSGYFLEAYKEIEELNFKAEKVGKYKVYTYLDKEKQTALETAFNESAPDVKKEVFIMNAKGEVQAVLTDNVNLRRPVGSVIKPMLVYAPAIEENIISPMTRIEDAKTDFGGYIPSNYHDVYKGFINCEEAINLSSNVVAVKVMNYLTPEKALKYADNLSIKIDAKTDANLSLALGSASNGIDLLQLTSAYTTFLNNGTHYTPKFIRKIVDPNGKTIYNAKETEKKVFSDDTSSLMNMLLKSNVQNGTAKKLKYLNFDVACKTGTVGVSGGNSDALAIAYTTENIMSVRLYKETELMDNSITGGSYPCLIIRNAMEKIYSSYSPSNFSISQNVQKVALDKNSYYNRNEIVEAADGAFEKDVIYGYFRTSNMPKNKANSSNSLKIESAKLLVKSKEIELRLCVKENVFYRIYKKTNNKELLIYDSRLDSNNDTYIDKDIKAKKVYEYYAIPYKLDNNVEVIGDKYYIGKVKISADLKPEVPTDWWNEDCGLDYFVKL